MNILIPNSWLKDYLETNATPKQFADAMSLTSVSIERMEKVGDDIIFDIEITTNRPDLMSIEGIAREASAVLPEQGYRAVFKPHKENKKIGTVSKSPLLNIVNDKTLVNRILAVVCEIDLGPSPKIISERLERAGIRSINNVVDVTNYIMRETGHPAHVFDYDRLHNHTLNIRRSKKGEKIVTLDTKEYLLPGDDIVADNGIGEIVDLLGIMGTANSVVTDTTKRIVLFLDNNNSQLLRKTSMNLGIRTEAAILNEKGVDPELMLPAMIYGMELLGKNANAKPLTPIIDIYPNKPKSKNVILKKSKLKAVVGLDIPEATVARILTSLGFVVANSNSEFIVTVPTTRINDIDIAEDIIEEVARVYGYHKIPNALPALSMQINYHQEKNEFYWIRKIKEAFLFWGYNEVYSYSMVSEELFEGPVENAVKLSNPLTEDRTYLRRNLIPSVLEVADQNRRRTSQKLFEVANVYHKKKNGLPDELLHLAVVLRDTDSDFFDGKGIVEQLFKVLGISKYSFENKQNGLDGASIMMNNNEVGVIETEGDVTIELDITQLIKFASLNKKYKEPAKFPPIIEDIRIEVAPHYSFSKIEKSIKNVNELIHMVALLDVYKNKKTFRITFQDRQGTLTNEQITPIRNEIYKMLEDTFKAIVG